MLRIIFTSILIAAVVIASLGALALLAVHNGIHIPEGVLVGAMLGASVGGSVGYYDKARRKRTGG